MLTLITVNYLPPASKIDEIKLPCGCLLGVEFCPEAHKLSKELTEAYQSWRFAPDSDWGKMRYEQAQTKFYQHFNHKENFNATEFNPHF